MKLIDLTLRLDESLRGVEFETKFTVDRDGWNAKTLHLYSHCGTHMDAPIHFGCGDQTIDEIPLQRCVVRAHIVNLESILPRQPILIEHLGTVADAVCPGEAILLRTGWSRRIVDAQDYRDNFPPISAELATWMVQHRVGLIGVEPPSVADVNDLAAVTEIHHILLGGDVVIVEGLCHLDQIEGDTCLLVALPLKIAGGDGAPCRAMAIEGVTIDG